MKKLMIAIVLFCSQLLAEPLSELPEQIKNIVMPVVNEVFPNHIDALSFEVLKGGYSKEFLYKVSFNENQYVLKLTTSEKSNSIKKEIQLATLASQYQLSPQVLYPKDSMGHSNAMLMEYIKSASPTTHMNTTSYEQIIQSLKTLHSISDPSLPKSKDLFHRTRAKLNKQKTSINVNNMLSKLDQIEAVLALEQSRPVLIHGDLNLNNILTSQNQVFLIDWVDAGLGNPLADIGYFTVLAGMDNEQAEQLLREYFKPSLPSSKDVAKMQLMRQVTYGYLVAFALQHIKQEAYTTFPEIHDTHPNLIESVYSGTFTLDSDINFAILAAACHREFTANIPFIEKLIQILE